MTSADLLTLGQKELIRGRSLTQCDAYGEPYYCVDCLADLPADKWEHWDHRCEDTTSAAPAEHKTRTFCPRPETGRFDKRGRPMHDRSAAAICTCGWSRWEGNRTLARAAARDHRAETIREAAGQ
jgi:hypothetical protein